MNATKRVLWSAGNGAVGAVVGGSLLWFLGWRAAYAIWFGIIMGVLLAIFFFVTKTMADRRGGNS